MTLQTGQKPRLETHVSQFAADGGKICQVFWVDGWDFAPLRNLGCVSLADGKRLKVDRDWGHLG